MFYLFCDIVYLHQCHLVSFYEQDYAVGFVVAAYMTILEYNGLHDHLSIFQCMTLLRHLQTFWQHSDMRVYTMTYQLCQGHRCPLKPGLLRSLTSSKNAWTGFRWESTGRKLDRSSKQLHTHIVLGWQKTWGCSGWELPPISSPFIIALSYISHKEESLGLTHGSLGDTSSQTKQNKKVLSQMWS